jgi:hypothetical protein
MEWDLHFPFHPRGKRWLFHLHSSWQGFSDVKTLSLETWLKPKVKDNVGPLTKSQRTVIKARRGLETNKLLRQGEAWEANINTTHG